MNRRTFVLSAMTAALAIPAWYYLKGNKDNAPQYLSMIWDNETIANVGHRYRVMFPMEANEATLFDLLPKERSLEEQILWEFETDKTILVDGWILSVTEARQCALFSLMQG